MIDDPQSWKDQFKGAQPYKPKSEDITKKFKPLDSKVLTEVTRTKAAKSLSKKSQMSKNFG